MKNGIGEIRPKRPRRFPRAVGLALCGLVGALPDAARAAGAADAPPRIALGGDVRVRWERTDEDRAPARDEPLLRARLDVRAPVTDGLTARLRLATGGNDPSARDATLDDAFSRKDFGVDLAALAWQPAAAPGWTLHAGKMEAPWLAVNDLVFARAVTPEGAAAGGRRDFGRWRGWLHAGAFVMDESAADDDVRLFSAQAALRRRDADGGPGATLAGASWFHFAGLEGTPPPRDAAGRGNRLRRAPDGSSVYACDFSVVEVFAERRAEWGWFPLTLAAGGAINLDAPDAARAGMAELTLGETELPGSGAVRAVWLRREANAVIAALAENDYGRGAGDRAAGLGAVWTPARGLRFTLTAYWGRLDDTGDDLDYRRIQADITAHF